MTATLYFLDLSGGRIVAVNPDGSEPRTLVSGLTGHPDGIIADPQDGHLYWTNMGNPADNDGSIERIGLDGGNRTTIVGAGKTFTPRQIQFDAGTLYWSDREGMRVMRAAADGSAIETLVQTGSDETEREDQRNWCVGIAVDRAGGKIYWTQKGADDSGQGRILRAGIDVPAGQTPANRTDVEVVYAGLPEPIDLDIDHRARMLYWTDRGDPPRGNTVNRAPLDAGPRGQARTRDPSRSSDGGHRASARHRQQSDVRDRLRWQCLPCGPRRVGRDDAAPSSAQSDRYRLPLNAQ